MSRIAPKPIIRQIVRKWCVEPGMSYAVAEDMEGRLWIEQSCPIGTHYWTIEQAAQLASGGRTERAIQEAVALGCERIALDRMPSLPAFDAELESAISGAPQRRHRTACLADSRLARV